MLRELMGIRETLIMKFATRHCVFLILIQLKIKWPHFFTDSLKLRSIEFKFFNAGGQVTLSLNCELSIQHYLHSVNLILTEDYAISATSKKLLLNYISFSTCICFCNKVACRHFASCKNCEI